MAENNVAGFQTAATRLIARSAFAKFRRQQSQQLGPRHLMSTDGPAGPTRLLATNNRRPPRLQERHETAEVLWRHIPGIRGHTISTVHDA